MRKDDKERILTALFTKKRFFADKKLTELSSKSLEELEDIINIHTPQGLCSALDYFGEDYRNPNRDYPFRSLKELMIAYILKV